LISDWSFQVGMLLVLNKTWPVLPGPVGA
jgi:hypothetical protein